MITPDTKDWTWVVERACPECGFDGPACDPHDVAARVRRNAADWEELHAAGVVRPGRPDGATWSPLEYACHVRDVFRRYAARIELMRTEDDPLFPNWDQDASAIDDRYEEQDPATVLADLRAAAEHLAADLDTVTDAEWARPGRRGDGAAFTVASISVYLAHDPIHHVWDVSGALARR